MKKLQNFFENQLFGVCTKLGEKLKIPVSSIRLFFIYSSFLTFGSPVLIYMSLAFLLNFRKHLRRRNNSVWYF
jgi:phage shock protein C